MLLLLSPAKKLDYDSPVRTKLHTQPLFVEQAQELISILDQKSASEIASLMKLSDALATLNFERYRGWSLEFDLRNSRQAILAFDGDVYDELQGASLSDKQLKWAQDHVAILSGLYGVLRPLDLMQPYRLEMGTRLSNERGSNLYAFWGTAIAEYINQHLATLNTNKSADQNVVLHLASEEYFKAVDRKALKAPVVQCVFQEFRNGAWKVISFNAKRARGMMARYVIENQLTRPQDLHGFNSAGYRYDPEESTPEKLFFRRESAQ